jgi:hypothetical protein
MEIFIVYNKVQRNGKGKAYYSYNIPKKKLRGPKSFMANSDLSSDMMDSRRASDEAVRMMSST